MKKSYFLKPEDDTGRVKEKLSERPDNNIDKEEAVLRNHEIKIASLERENQELQEAFENASRLTERFKFLFEYAPTGYFALDRHANIREVNYRGAKMLKKGISELTGQNFLNFISPASVMSFTRFMEDLFSNSLLSSCEIWIESGDSPGICISLKGVISGNYRNCLIIANDITRRKLAEKALKEREVRLTELNATKDKFLSIISHDLKSPFTSIVGLSKLLKEKVKQGDTDDIMQYAEYIRISSLKAMDLLDNLLQWSATQTGKINIRPENLNLNQLVDHAINISHDAAIQKGINIKKQIPSDVVVYADKEMLNIIFRNLLSNAVKFTHPGGNITIYTKQRIHDLLIQVTDDGIGINPEMKKKLFKVEETFTTRGTMNESGTGLGLLLVKEFITAHDGNIWIESETGKGSTFNFTLPKIQEKINRQKTFSEEKLGNHINS